MFPRNIEIGDEIHPGSGAFSLVFYCKFKYAEKGESIHGALKMVIVSQRNSVQRKRLELNELESCYYIDNDEDLKLFEPMMNEYIGPKKILGFDDVVEEIHCAHMLSSMQNQFIMPTVPIIGVTFVELIRKKKFEPLTPSRLKYYDIKPEPRDRFSPVKSLFGRVGQKKEKGGKIKKSLFQDDEEDEGEEESDNEEEEKKPKERSVLFDLSGEGENDDDDDFFSNPDKYAIVETQDPPNVLSPVMPKLASHGLNNSFTDTHEELEPYNIPTQPPTEKSLLSSLPAVVVEQPNEGEEEEEKEKSKSSKPDEGDQTPPSSIMKKYVRICPQTGDRLPPPTPGKGCQPPPDLTLAFILMPLMDGSLTDLTMRRKMNICEFPPLRDCDKIRFWYEYLTTQIAMFDTYIHFDARPGNFLFRYDPKKEYYQFYMSDFGINSRTKHMEKTMFRETYVTLFKAMKELVRSMCYKLEEDVTVVIPELTDLVMHLGKINKVYEYVFVEDYDPKEDLRKFFRDALEIIEGKVVELVEGNETIGRDLMCSMSVLGKLCCDNNMSKKEKKVIEVKE